MLNITRSREPLMCTACGEWTIVVTVLSWPHEDKLDASEVTFCAKCAKRMIVMVQKHLVGLDALHAPIALTKPQARYQHEVNECITTLTSVPITTLPERVRVALHRVTEAASQFIANVGRTDSWA